MRIFTWANILSFFRIAIAPLFLVMMFSTKPAIIAWACILFLIGALTDYFDGWLARKMKDDTKLGRFVDPLADKFLTTAAFLVFALKDIIPLWMVIIIIVRDFGITFMRLYGHSSDKPIKTSYLAKVKTFLQMFFISYVLALIFLVNLNLGFYSPEYLETLIASDVTLISMFIITVITVVSLFEYIYTSYFYSVKEKKYL